MSRDRMELALYKASIHVFRQQHAGKHEQDRQDATVWLAEYADLVSALQKKFQGKGAKA